jgi:Bacterial regulatory helix-turn-helix protein, lysR family
VNLDLFRLLVFVTVVDCGGYSAAGRRLNLTQSTVSHHVGELERACGGELVRYRDRSVHVTAAGCANRSRTEPGRSAGKPCGAAIEILDTPRQLGAAGRGPIVDSTVGAMQTARRDA